MMNPVCAKCGVFMRCKKNGYVVGFHLGRRYDSDLYECLECDNEVAILAAVAHPDTPANGIPATPDLRMRKDQ